MEDCELITEKGGTLLIDNNGSKVNKTEATTPTTIPILSAFQLHTNSIGKAKTSFNKIGSTYCKKLPENAPKIDPINPNNAISIK